MPFSRWTESTLIVVYVTHKYTTLIVAIQPFSRWTESTLIVVYRHSQIHCNITQHLIMLYVTITILTEYYSHRGDPCLPLDGQSLLSSWYTSLTNTLLSSWRSMPFSRWTESTLIVVYRHSQIHCNITQHLIMLYSHRGDPCLSLDGLSLLSSWYTVTHKYIVILEH